MDISAARPERFMECYLQYKYLTVASASLQQGLIMVSTTTNGYIGKLAIVPLYFDEKLHKHRKMIKRTYLREPKPNCNFIFGFCRKYRGNMGKDHSSGRWFKCCCDDCAAYFGYYNSIYFKDVQHILPLFDGITGFLRPSGCILPRELRSNTCLSYSCSEARRTKCTK